MYVKQSVSQQNTCAEGKTEVIFVLNFDRVGLGRGWGGMGGLLCSVFRNCKLVIRTVSLD